MTKSKQQKLEESKTIEKVKRLAIKAIFSDDDLLEELVLKGGNAMAFIHHIDSRMSMDLDFSMQEDFPAGREDLYRRIQAALTRMFMEEGFSVFDLKMEEQPKNKPSKGKDKLDFWSGHKIEFKIATKAVHQEYGANMEQLRKHAIHIGNSPKLQIDISCHEYTKDKEWIKIDGYVIYFYTPLMIVCEKLRAVCQQIPEYSNFIMRSGRPGSPRSRDFYDIHRLVEKFNLDMFTGQALDMVRQMFDMKRVPIDFLDLIPEQFYFHENDFNSLKQTIAPGEKLEPFAFYFDHVVDLVQRIRKELLEAQKPDGT